MTGTPAALRVVAWGTYDLGKPRVRILLRGLRENGVEVIECHREVWGGVEDKSQLKGWRQRLYFGLRWLLAYPSLLLRYLRLPPHDVLLVPYMGQLDILVLWPLARLRRCPIVFDAFLSLYNTVVEDRQLLHRRHPLAWLLFAWEWLACRAGDLVLVDTDAHGRYFHERFGVPMGRLQRVFVGVEGERFPPLAAGTPRSHEPPLRVLFYGQFIPLHGIETVLRAAKLTEQDGIAWALIGTGQEAARMALLMQELAPTNLTWETWVPYAELVDRLHAADLCLGVFGTTAKALRVIPNKVFQIIASGRPLLTADSPAARELLTPGEAIFLVPPGDPAALAQAVREFRACAGTIAADAHPGLRARIEPGAVVAPLVARLYRLAGRDAGPAANPSMTAT